MSALPAQREPTEVQINAVAASILAHLKLSATEWHEALSDRLGAGKPPRLGEALRDGDDAEAGRLAREAALSKLAEDAEDMAERWFYDNFTEWERKRLALWRPVRFASLGRAYHLAEMLP